MRLKLTLPVLAGAIAFSIAGFAIASPGKSLIDSGVKALSTIGDMVSTSLWNTHELAHTTKSEPVSTNANPITLPQAPTAHAVAYAQTDHPYADLPGTNSPVSHYSSPAYADAGQSNFITGDSRNTFVGELGGSANGGFVHEASSSGGVSNYIPGSEIAPGVGNHDVTTTVTTPTPEPGEWILMLLGLGLVGYVTKLRKRKTGSGLNA